MRQKQSETLIVESLKDPTVKKIYVMTQEYPGHVEWILLNAIHRHTQVPKFQIVTYLNKKGFNYATDRAGNDK